MRCTAGLLLLLAVMVLQAMAQLPASVVSPDGSSANAPHIKVSLVSSSAVIAPGAGFQTGLHFQMEKGWHVYWVNAGDSGEPPRIRWHLPRGITAGPMQFPAPKRIPYGPLLDFGYPGEVLFPIDMEVAHDLVSGAPAKLAADVDWLVCRESCIPGKATIAITLGTGAAAQPNAAGQKLIQAWNNRLPKPLPADDVVAYSPDVAPFRLMVHTATTEHDVQFFPSEHDQVDNDKPEIVKHTDFGFVIDMKKSEDLKAAPSVLNGVLEFGDGSAYEVHAQRGPLVYASSAKPVTPSRMGGLVEALGLAFVGGVILNLMPCVFPVLFIKALALVQSSREQRHEMRRHGLVYALGILVSFWAVVTLLLILRAGGQHLGWGFQFQSPGFIAMIALLLFFLGLSLAGMFEIGLSMTSAGGSLAQKQGYAGSFFTGVLAMVVATPCTAPFMGAAIGYALAQPPGVIFLVFTTLGIGLAAPYLFLAFNPAWTRLLPKPGAWMEVLKQATAVPIFGTVIWLVWLFTQSAGPDALAGLLAAFLLLGVAAWVLGRWPARRIAVVAAAIVIIAAIIAPLYAVHAADAGKPSVAVADTKSSASDDWVRFTPSIVASLQAQGKPVLVDFTANWCLSCKVNERVVLDRPEVKARLKASNIALVRADWTHHDDDVAQALATLGRSGVPAYAVYSAHPGDPPVLLPEVLTSGILFDAVDHATTNSTTPHPGAGQ